MSKTTTAIDLETFTKTEERMKTILSPDQCLWRGYSRRQYDEYGWPIHRDCDYCESGKRNHIDQEYDVSECYRLVQYKELLDDSGLTGKALKHTFQAAKIDKYNEKLYRYLADEWTPEKGGVYITAQKTKDNPQGNGTGKTYALHATVHKLCRMGIRCLYARTVDFLTDLKSAYEEGTQKSESKVLRKYMNVPVLIWDDLGKENIRTEWGPEKFYQVIDYRAEMELPIVISSNFLLDELATRFGADNFGPAIVSRLAGACYGQIFVLGGPDRRFKQS